MSEMLAMFEGICHQCQTNIPRYIQCAMSEPFYWFAIGFAFNFWNHSAIRKACVWSYFGRNSKVEGSACQAPRFLAKGLRNWWKAQFCGIHLEWLVGWFHWFYVQHVKLSTRKLRTFATWLSLRWRKSGRLWILLRVSQLQTDIDRSYENVYLVIWFEYGWTQAHIASRILVQDDNKRTSWRLQDICASMMQIKCALYHVTSLSSRLLGAACCFGI